ncbi:glycoside hydrolase superfamily [Nemania sp. FL0031]|nr:glycoside hydrolase superfamily [Nemania sp. FL0031]
MGRSRTWALAHSLLVGIVSAIESSGECALVTTTIYLPTTIYAFAPNTTVSRGGDSCIVTSSSSIPIGTSTSSSTGTTEDSTPTSTPSVPTTSSESVTTIPSTTPTSASITPTSRVNSTITTGSSVPTTTALPTPTSIGGLPPPPPSPPLGPFKGYKNTVYFTNWGISQEKYIPQKLPVDDLSHVLYAFADIAPNGTVLSANPVADLSQKYSEDRDWEPGRNAYGAVKQLYIHKKWNRHMKVLLSVGGGEFSPKFAAATSTEMRRQTFAKSAVKLVTDWGFDGLDIDWEYPTNESERDNLVKLLAACREAFDRYSFHNHLHYRFLVTVASPASAANWKFVDLPRMDRYVDIWHLMSYDYSGSWNPRSGHQSNVFANKANEASTPLNTNDAVKHYESLGIRARKIVVGLPLYGRSFNGTSGLGQNYTSVGTGGPQPGVWYYKDLPKAGAREDFDDVAKATYSYDRKTRELISYDDVRSTTFKAHYVRDRGLGGAFFWEASGDRAGRGSLVKTMTRALDWMDRTPNNLHYPTSQYRNIRLGVPGE